jgi:multicomponent Na+:H+ antiporter subunit D
VADPLAVVPPAVLFFVAAGLAAALPRRVGVPAAVAAVALALPWLLAVPAGSHLATRAFGFAVVPFRVDPLSRAVGLTLSFAAVAAGVYAFGTGSSRTQVALAFGYLGAGVGAVFAGDWLTLVVAWELLALLATALAWTSGDEAARAGLRYAAYHELGGVVLVAAALTHYLRAGTFLYDGGLAAGLPALLGALGIGLNVGFVGLHPWLVDTYPKPHVATSVVYAATTTKVGVYALARAFPEGHVAVAYVGGAMLLVGVTFAILQRNLRRLLSYHIVSQVGIMVAGVGVGTGLGLAGAVAHLANNVLYKSLLFAVAGVVAVETGEESLSKLGGLRDSMPRTALAFAVAAAAIAGVPGLNGFVSKGMVFDAVDAAGLEVLWWALLVGSVGTIVSFLKFGYYAFSRAHAPEGGGLASPGDVGPAAGLAFALLAVPCVVFGLAPSLQFALLPGAPAAAKPFSPSQFQKAGAILAAGGVAFLLVRKPLSRVGDVPDLDAVYHPLGARLLSVTVALIATAASAVDAAAGRVAGAAAATADPDTLDRLPGGATDAVGRTVLLVVLSLVALLLLSLV